MRPITLILLALALAAPALAEERAPQRDSMVHMDLSGATPRYIPDEISLIPGGIVQLMLFGKGPAHSLTLDEPGYDADVASGTAEGFYERLSQFNAPSAPGTYPFHDKHSNARGTLIVRSLEEPFIIGVRERGYELYFEPERLEVPGGSMLTFRTNGSFAHTLTSETSAWNDSTLELAPGQSAIFRAPTAPGEYPFYCRYHKDGGMTGMLVVTTAVSPAPATPAAPTNETPAASLDIVGVAAIMACLIARGPLALLRARRVTREPRAESHSRVLVGAGIPRR